mgnify:CR=1 FL=1
MDKDTINILVQLVGLALIYLGLRRDNRKSNEESFEKVVTEKLSHEKQITDLKDCFNKDLNELKTRLSLLEQESKLKDAQSIKEMSELKRLIETLQKKIDKLIENEQ